MKLRHVAALAFAGWYLVLCAGCGSHDASDPSYGAMFKQNTHDRLTGNEFWGSRTQKDCVSSGTVTVCTPKGQDAPPAFPSN